MYDSAAGHFAAMLFLQRMRTPADRAYIRQTFIDVWGILPPILDEQSVTVTPERMTMGWASLVRSSQGTVCNGIILQVLPCSWGSICPHHLSPAQSKEDQNLPVGVQSPAK